MVSVDKVSVLFGGFALLDEISFLIIPKDRIGLVGKNGAGKTTLLKMLAFMQEPSLGQITKPKDITLGYLPQHMVHQDGKTVKEEALVAFSEILDLQQQIESVNKQLSEREDYESEYYLTLIDDLTHLNEHFTMLGGNDFEGEVEKALLGLGFLRSDFDRPSNEFSGGWRMRIELVKILLRKPDLMLLDEPTNHLDIESIQWLEDFLKGYPGAIILVSHDRAFLDNVTQRTIEISLGRIYDYKAPYTKYLQLRVERRETELRAFQNQQKLIKETEDFISRFRYQATKAVQVQSRVKQLDKLDRIEIDLEDRSSLRLKFPPAPRSGTIVAEAEHYSVGYGDHMVLKDVGFIIERGEKVAYVGKNGEGKTTLVKALMEQLQGKGTLKLGHNVKIGYFAQNQADCLDPNLSVFQTIDDVAVGAIRTRVRDILGAFMFGGEASDKKVSVLSGGERSRLAMIKLLLEPVNLLVLDEPTNHLDMQSKEVLKDAIKAFEGTAIIVSHDRDFLDGLVDKLYEFGGGELKEHLGGIYEFLDRKKLDTLQQLEFKNKSNTGKKTKASVKRKDTLSYNERKELNKQVKYAERGVEDIEKKVAKLEQHVLEMEGQLAAPENLSDSSLFDNYRLKKIELEQTMVYWEAQLEELELLKTKKEENE